jgi:hypothetical protein
MARWRGCTGTAKPGDGGNGGVAAAYLHEGKRERGRESG